MSCSSDKPHDDCSDVTHKIQALESKLEIAREALKSIVNDREGDYDFLIYKAKDALARMEDK